MNQKQAREWARSIAERVLEEAEEESVIAFAMFGTEGAVYTFDELEPEQRKAAELVRSELEKITRQFSKGN